ncbi:MAG TPA: hypothetical protein VH701_00430 [Vicinamibacterales bacterium]|jgi:Spy/CpxP family protein refolding chaperone
MSRSTLWAGLAVLFGAGVLTGVVSAALYADSERTHRGAHGPAAQHERIMNRLAQQLSLTAEQRAEVEPIVTRTHVAVLALRFSHQPEVEQILTRGMMELKEKLSAEQRSELDRMYARLQQRWQVSKDYLETHGRGTTPP